MSEKYYQKCFDKFGMFWLIKLIGFYKIILEKFTGEVGFQTSLWSAGEWANAQPSLAGCMGLCGYMSAASLAPRPPSQ
jgi:hypothetical protein